MQMSIIAKITGFFKKNPQNSEKDGLLKSHYYIGKFVKQDNTDIGESIGVEGKRIVIKNPENIMSIPIEAIMKNAENIIVGDFDRKKPSGWEKNGLIRKICWYLMKKACW